MASPTPTTGIPDAFLISDTSNPISPWKINQQSTAWNWIFADQTLQLQDVSPSGKSLTVSSGQFWGLSFSDDANAAIFGDSSPAVSPPQDTNVGGAVLGMVAPTTAPLNASTTFSDARTHFGISSTNAPALLNSFLDAIDQSNTLAVKLDVSPSTRNALWAVLGPGNAYQVVVSLTFDVVDAGILANLESFLNKQFGLSFSLSNVLPQIVLTSLTTYTPASTQPESMTVSSSYIMIIRFQIATFQVLAHFTPTDVSLILTDNGTAPSNQSIYQRLSGEVMSSSGSGGSSKIGPNDLPSGSGSSAFDKFLSTIILWNVTIGIENSTVQTSSGSTSSNTGNNVYWQVGLLANWQIPSSTQKQLAAMTYDSRISMFSGKLIFSQDVTPPPDKRQYDYQSWTDLPSSVTSASLAPNLDIAAVFGAKNPPSQLPTKIVEASIVYQKSRSGDGYTLAASGSIVSSSTPTSNTTSSTSSSSAPSHFDWSSIYMNVLLQNDGSDTDAVIQVFANIDLAPSTSGLSPSSGSDTPVIFIDLEFVSNKYWYLEAQADNIPISNLSSYFDSSAHQAVSTLGGLILNSLDILYTFSDQGDASSFLITAVLSIGELELDLYYQYISSLQSGQSAADLAWPDGAPDQVSTVQASGQATWTLEAFLGSTSPNSTIQSVFQSIAPNSSPLPGFVGNIQVNPANGGNSPGKLKLQSVGGVVLLVIQLLLADLDFTFVTIWKGSGSKMVLRISVDKIPLISSIPLINSLPQPFDSLLYLWLDDDSGVGLTSDELNTINGQLSGPLNIPPIVVKNTNNSGSADVPAALQSGHHFMVLQKGDVILDHVFNNADSTDPNLPDPATSQSLLVRQLDTTSSTNDPAPTKGNLDVQLPFLSIDAVTLQFKQASLFIDIDATMMLGPISVSVIGFEVVLHLTKVQLNHLEDMLTNGFITFGLHGLSVDIDETPLEISGIFIHQTVNQTVTVNGQSVVQSVDEYLGGLSVGFEEWQLLAVGAYELITLGQDQYKSIFIFAKLDGPLVSLAFATISGVRFGFGYNSIVRSPTMDELPQFPFLSGSADGTGNDPMAVLTAMTGGNGEAWVAPKEDSYWVAAGLTLTAFGILSITAVVMLGFHDSGVVISVIADGIAQMPPDVDSDETLFYVEIFMIAELNTVEGYFSVQASLAPSSHILVPSCRLTGGFALVNWFDPNTHSGDFVFSVGGFHPAYTPPAWYPVPARLGISFTLGSMINVTGTVYFAITPKCVMGGGALHMGLDVGPVSAWLDVALDVFIQFKPFHYTADLTVSVGCAITINVWFVHVRVSISVGASLHIQGPDPFGGVANVDFSLFSFTIHFGGQSPQPPGIGLFDFYKMVETPGPAPDPDSSATPADPAMAQLKFVLTAGLYQPPSPPPVPSTTVWNTKAGTFACMIGCSFALSAALLITDQQTPNPSTTPVTLPDGTTNAPVFYSQPMHTDNNSQMTSTLSVTVWALNADGTKNQVISGFGSVMVMKDVPAALWGPYSRATDPAYTPTPPALTQPNQPTMQLCMGVSVSPPVPVLFASPIQDFDATAAFWWSLGTWVLPALVPTQNVSLASGVMYTNDTPEDRWQKVADDWTAFGNKGATILGGTVTDGVQSPGLLQMIAQTLGWDQPLPSANISTRSTSTGPTATGSSTTAGTTTTTPASSAVPTAASWMLNGTLPDMLIASLATQYPVLPRYSATGTATS